MFLHKELDQLRESKLTRRYLETGYMLMFTLIALMVGVIIAVPVLSFVSTTHLTTAKTLERWEASLTREAGVEYGIAKLRNNRSILTSLSSAPLTSVPLPLPPTQTNGQTVTSVTATLLTPGQWNLVKHHDEVRDLYVSSLPPELLLKSNLPPPVPVTPPKVEAILGQAPIITVTKTASPSYVAPGAQITYTIQLTNSGDQIAATNSIEDTLPAGSDFSYILGSTVGGITADPNVTQGGRRLTWNSVPNIAIGATLTYSFRVLAGSVSGQFYNTVSVNGQNYSDVSTGNTAPVFVGTQMRVTKTVSPSVAPAGTNIIYTITIFNDTVGTNASLTEVTDTLPNGFSYVNNSTAGSITSNPQITGQVNLKWTGTWTVNGGSSFSFSFQATTTLNWGTYYNSIAIKGTNFPDLSTGPTAGVTTVGWIQLSKIVDNPSPGPEEVVTYTITANNSGPSAVTVTKITDTLPPTFTYVVGSTSGAVSGNPSITGNTLTWEGAQIPSSIAAGAQISFNFKATVPSTSNTYYDEAKIFVNWLGNNYTITTGDTAPVTVVVQARITISESSGDTSGPPGWSNVNVKGYNFPPNKIVRLYWVDLNNTLNPTNNPPTGTNLLPGQTIITLSSSSAPVSFNPVSITIPANANWGNGYVAAVMEKSTGTWVEQDRKPFNVRAKYEIVSQTSNGITLTARAAFTGSPSPDGKLSTPTNTPLITIYQWKE